MSFSNFIIDRIKHESSTISSFYLKPGSGQLPSPFRPGQFISIRLPQQPELVRQYSLSDAPGKDYYRISVKKEEKGIFSQKLHDQYEEGDVLEVSQPAGHFCLNNSTNQPVVLLSGGVGIAPLLSMLEYLAANEPERRVFFLHSSRNKLEQPFLARIREITRQQSQFFITIHHSQPLDEERQNADYDYYGHINFDFLQEVLPSVEMEYYMCGPESFMQSIFAILKELGVAANRIYYEFFGERKILGDEGKSSNDSQKEWRVHFAISGKTVAWSGESNNLLEFAERNGLNPDHSCRMGTCNTCETDLLEGKVEYDPEPFVDVPEGKLLTCCSRPRSHVKINL